MKIKKIFPINIFFILVTNSFPIEILPKIKYLRYENNKYGDYTNSSTNTYQLGAEFIKSREIWFYSVGIYAGYIEKNANTSADININIFKPGKTFEPFIGIGFEWFWSKREKPNNDPWSYGVRRNIIEPEINIGINIKRKLMFTWESTIGKNSIGFGYKI